MRPPRLPALLSTAALLLACGGHGSGSGSPSGSDDAGGTDAEPEAAPGDGGVTLDPAGNPPTSCAAPGGASSNPPAVSEMAGVLDVTGRSFVVFGGDTAVPICGPPPTDVFAGDTYVLDVGCVTWTKSSGGPSARARHAMTLDPGANRAVLFGGQYSANGTTYEDYADVWAFDFASSSWSQIQTTGTAPSPRVNTATTVDPGSNRLVVFGGNASTDPFTLKPQSDTWTLDLGTGAWTQVAATGTKPPARQFHEMAVDPDGEVAYVFAGAGANAFTGSFFSDVWALDLTQNTWQEVTTTGTGPGGRIEGALVFDRVAKRLLAFAGHDDGAIGNENDLFALDVTQSPAVWSKLPPGDTPGKPATGTCSFPPDFTSEDKSAPERRSELAYAPRVDGRAFIVFAGAGDCGLMADTWWWADGAGAWTNVQPSPVGLSCERVQTSCTSLCN
ncbi:MAG: Kelch repeat-containing protein [Polyangiaceae bacterium]